VLLTAWALMPLPLARPLSVPAELKLVSPIDRKPTRCCCGDSRTGRTWLSLAQRMAISTVSPSHHQ
jgi:hypothetical protein